ncbi:hypothetical protein ABZ502_02625 [Streptomyces abikoensis]|uniref:hypothetical protein n=1 Tax=Streptomyces abikoensis TaxID=97398 RepID=UPI0033DAAF8A
MNVGLLRLVGVGTSSLGVGASKGERPTNDGTHQGYENLLHSRQSCQERMRYTWVSVPAVGVQVILLLNEA